MINYKIEHKTKVMGMRIQLQMQKVFTVLLFLMLLGIPELLIALQGETAQIQRVTLSDIQQNFYKGDIEKEISVTLHEVTLDEALNYIAKVAGLRLTYRGDILKENNVTILKEAISVSAALEHVLDGTGLEYKFSQGGYLMIAEINEVIESTVYQETIHGQVLDANTGESLPGVNIVVEGTNIGVATDIEGSFELTVPSLDETLIITYIGYQRLEIPIDGRTEFEILLSPQAFVGEELVVVGYGEQSAETLTGSISTVRSEDIMRTGATTTGGALVGKMQGINFRQTDGRPGRNPSLSIRNMGDPLYVIDGIPQYDDRAFNQIGMDDIESISILKDASAAIYGLRAANGVVLVTTKSSSSIDDSKPTININSNYGFHTFTRFPTMSNAYQYVRAIVEAEQNEGLPPSYSSDELERWRQGTEPGYQSFDYYDFVMRPYVPQYTINANVSGSAADINYYIAGGYISQEALTKGHDYNRYNFQGNMNTNITDNLRFGAQTSGRIERRLELGLPGGDDYNNMFASVFQMWPIERPFANDNPNYVNNVNNVNVNPATYTFGTTGYSDETFYAYRGNFFLEYEFDFGLAMRGTYSYGQELFWFEEHEYRYQAYEYRPETDEYYTEPGWGNQNPWRRKLRETRRENFFQFQLNYETQIENHYISAVTAFEQQERIVDQMRYNTVPTQDVISITRTADFTNLLDFINEDARAGIIGRVNYDYNLKYLVEVMARYDGSYLYYEGNRWGLFPGLSLGWRISEEPFMDNFTFLEDLKIRASYGEMGGEAGVSAFDYVDGYTYGQGSAVLDGTTHIGIQHRGLPVRNLSWITNKSTNIGLDFVLLDNTFTGSLDVFQRKREGLPASRYDVLLPSEVGFNLPFENLESDLTRGIEGSLRYLNTVGEVAYSIGINATLARHKHFESYRPRFANSLQEYHDSIENRWSNIRWGYQVVGQFQSMDEINNHPINNDGQGNTTHLPGDFIFKDVNGDGVINHLDRRPIAYGTGNNNTNRPLLNFGTQLQFNWKGLNLAANFSGGAMHTIARSGYIRLPFQSNGNSPEYLFEDRWHRVDPYDPNSEWMSGTYPPIRRNQAAGHVNYQRDNDFWVVNVRYFRLNNLQLEYTVPFELISTIGISNLRVFASGSNLFSIDNVRKYEIDPEIGRGDSRVYPTQRLFSFGINITI